MCGSLRLCCCQWDWCPYKRNPRVGLEIELRSAVHHARLHSMHHHIVGELGKEIEAHKDTQRDRDIGHP